jgi:two-component system, OmpR family, phosphate regulon sensor histidine kinase PhoR
LNKDLARLSIVILGSLIIGIISRYILLSLVIGLLVYTLWYTYTINNLITWMIKGKKSDPPNVSGLINDIANQVYSLKNRHKKRKKKLTSYLKRFKVTIDALPDAIIILDDQNEIKWANEKAEEYLGIIYLENVDQCVVTLIRTPALLELIEKNHTNNDASEFSINIPSPVDRKIQLEIRLIIFGKSEKLLVARNITKNYKINKMRTDFISNASHELRTPLTVITGYLESFDDELTEEKFPDVFKRIEQMKSQSLRMNRLVEDLLSLALLETTEELNNVESINMAEMLASIIDMAESVAGADKYEIKLNVEKNIWVKGNRNQLYSALSNIILNAVNYTSSPGVITVRWSVSKNIGKLEVEDTGIGIQPEHIPRLTERFFRVDKSRSRDLGGSGLGLAIVKHILAAHKLNLEIESKLGIGSIFRIIFPESLIVRENDIKKSKIKKMITS